MPKVRIFQVAYDPSLLRVRAEMLKLAGYNVLSVLGNEEARDALEQDANYQLVVVGWSGTDAARTEIVQWLKKCWPALRVIALYRAGSHAIAEADLNSCSESPAEWFNAVTRAAS
jgi:DNA-binding NtrC family response regulator